MRCLKRQILFLKCNGFGLILSGNMDLDSFDDDSQELIEEAERWEREFKSVSSEIQIIYTPVTGALSRNLRISLYKFLYSFEWEEKLSKDTLYCLIKTPASMQEGLIVFLISLSPKKVPIFLSFYLKLNEILIHEVLTYLSGTEILYFLETIRFLEENEKSAMHQIMEELSFSELLNIIKRCSEPMAKACRLCKTKRLYELEFKMLQNNLPENMVRESLNIAIAI